MAGVPREYVYVHLRRLRSKGKIRTVKVRSRPKEYHVNDVGCLLSEIWA